MMRRTLDPSSARKKATAADAFSAVISSFTTELLLLTNSRTMEEGSFEMVGFFSLANARLAASPNI